MQLHKHLSCDYPDAAKLYIVFTDASDDAWGAQLSQEHDETQVFNSLSLSHLH